MPQGDARVRLVVGPSAGARLDTAAAWLAAIPADAGVLVVGPGWEACDDLARGALGDVGARVGMVRLTLDRLAARLAAPALARARRAPVTGLSLVAVTARAVHRLLGEGALDYFAPVADRPGFPGALARTLDELRMHGVTPDALARLPHGGGDLARLATAVAAEMDAAGVADRSAVFAAAVVAAAALPSDPLLLLDVAVTSTLEERLVATVAGRAARVLATAVAGDAVTLERLERALGCRADVLSDAPASRALADLQRHLFADTAPERVLADDGVLLAAWPGIARECVEIARAVQTEAAAGVPFDRMAVVLHAPAEYTPHLSEAFARAEIPCFLARGAKRPHPAGRALLTLLACAGEGLSARRFAEYLSLSQVPEPQAVSRLPWAPPESDLLPTPPAPEPPPDADPLPNDPDVAPVSAGTLRAPQHWEQLLVEASVIGGDPARWRDRLAVLGRELEGRRQAAIADEAEARAEHYARQLRNLAPLTAFALPVIERLAALPHNAVWDEWLRKLRDLATHALREPDAVLATLTELEPMAPVGPVDLDEVRLVLTPRLRELTEPPPRRRYGRVLVVPTSAVRGMAFDVVFVPGLAEHLFPGKIGEDPLLLDAQRRALDGATLTMESQRAAGERLALRLAVGAARRRVVLSYPRVDVEKGRPRVPSFYALEALRAAEGELPGFEELARRAEQQAQARLGWPAPESPDAAIDEAEYDLALLAPLLEVDPDTTRGTATYLLEANPHLARALRARARRWIKRWTPADGLVDPDELARAALAAHQLDTRSFSPTALQHFAACPYRFFLQAIHRLAPREEPVAVEVMDPLTRGALFHDVQFGVLMRLREAGLLPLRPDGIEPAFRVLDEVLAAEEAELREQLKPAIARVWEDGIDGLRADLHDWLKRQADATDGWEPWRFELAFGLPPGERMYADPASNREPARILDGLSLRGSIDLVERHPRGMLRATDHKTGKIYAKDGVVVGGGQVLQPLLYALATEQLLRERVESGRLYYCTSTGEYQDRVVPLDARGRETIAEVVRVIGEALRDGFLPAAPASKACTWCDYRPVCGPYEELRVERKPRERLSALDRLRALP